LWSAGGFGRETTEATCKAFDRYVSKALHPNNPKMPLKPLCGCIFDCSKCKALNFIRVRAKSAIDRCVSSV
ncbi:MAG: hypothetical protein RRZ42_02700, partial [Oscillospiraceae bacterium]